MVRRLAVCVLVGTLGLGIAPRPASAAPARVVTGSHYRCMYHCDERGHRVEDSPRPQASGRRTLAQTAATTPPKSTFCRRNAPDAAGPPVTFVDRLMSWLYAAFCTSPAAQPAAAPAQPPVPPLVGQPAPAPAPAPPPVPAPVLKPPGLKFPPIQWPPILQPPIGHIPPPPGTQPPPATQPPPTTGKPGPWWPPSRGWPDRHGSSGWGGQGWGHHDGGWGQRDPRRHDDDDRWDCRKKRDHDDDRREHRQKRDHEDRSERRKQRDWDGWR